MRLLPIWKSLTSPEISGKEPYYGHESSVLSSGHFVSLVPVLLGRTNFQTRVLTSWELIESCFSSLFAADGITVLEENHPFVFIDASFHPCFKKQQNGFWTFEKRTQQEFCFFPTCARFQISALPAFSCCCFAARDTAMDCVEGKILAIVLVQFVSVQEN